MAKGKGKGRKSGRTTELTVAERHEFTSGGLLGHDSGEYAVNVTERTALGIDAVYACVLRLADAVGGARVGEFRGDDRLDPPSRLVRRPMSTMTRREWLWFVTATMALYNVVYLRRLGRDSDNVALSLVPIVPTRLSRVRDAVLLDGRERIEPDDLVRIRRTVWPTVTEELGTVLKLAREVFAAAWAQSAYTSDFWENGGAPQVVITTDQALTNPEAEAIRDRWAEARRDNPGKPAVIGKGGMAKPFGADLAGAEVGDDRLLAAVARFFGMPSWLVNAPSASGSMVYSNTESAGLDLVRYTLGGYLGPIGDALSDELPGDYLMGRRVELDVPHLTAGTLLERYQAFAIATGDRPFMTPAEVRAELHMPRDMGLDPDGAPAPALERIPMGV